MLLFIYFLYVIIQIFYMDYPNILVSFRIIFSNIIRKGIGSWHLCQCPSSESSTEGGRMVREVLSYIYSCARRLSSRVLVIGVTTSAVGVDTSVYEVFSDRAVVSGCETSGVIVEPR